MYTAPPISNRHGLGRKRARLREQRKGDERPTTEMVLCHAFRRDFSTEKEMRAHLQLFAEKLRRGESLHFVDGNYNAPAAHLMFASTLWCVLFANTKDRLHVIYECVCVPKCRMVF